MAIQCSACFQCKTCKNIGQINASSYNAYREQVTMEELVKFTPGSDGEPGYFMSAIPITPYNLGTIRGNKETADMHNRSMVAKLLKDPSALEGVRQEMDKMMSLGFIKKLKDLPKEVQEEVNADFKHFITNTIAYKETSASTKVRICWDSSRTSKQLASFLTQYYSRARRNIAS